MGISQFPPAASGGGLSNDFILNRNNSTNNTFILPREFEAGGYALVTSSNDSSFDVYLLNASGSSVGYTNGSSIVANEAFAEVVVLGVGTAETIQFSYRGPSTNATTQGLEPGAGAYLTSVFPSDLQNINDTATVSGGNFSTAVQITFESGTVVLPAKNTVVGSSTAIVVTRPDNLINDLSPYTLRAVNPGVTQPTGTNSNILVGTITAGADPSFVTDALLIGARPGSAYSTSIVATDSDGTVVNWAVTAGTLPPGLTLATATGVISGTPSVAGDYFFTVRITDDGQNTNSRQFNLPVGFVLSGANSTVVGGTTYAWWTTSGSAVYKNATSQSLPYIAIAGGGGGGSGRGGGRGGGGGAGGLLFGTATLTASIATAAITIGAGGAGGGSQSGGSNGTDSIIAAIGTAFGGGGGGYRNDSIGANSNGANGGSGGGKPSWQFAQAGLGTAGQGNNGGAGTDAQGGGGGGAGAAGGTVNGGDGRQFGPWASAINIIYNAGFFAGGGGYGISGSLGGNGGGGSFASVGSANSGGGGGGSTGDGPTGGSGLVIVRWT